MLQLLRAACHCLVAADYAQECRYAFRLLINQANNDVGDAALTEPITPAARIRQHPNLPIHHALDQLAGRLPERQIRQAGIAGLTAPLEQDGMIDQINRQRT